MLFVIWEIIIIIIETIFCCTYIFNKNQMLNNEISSTNSECRSKTGGFKRIQVNDFPSFVSIGPSNQSRGVSVYDCSPLLYHYYHLYSSNQTTAACLWLKYINNVSEWLMMHWCLPNIHSKHFYMNFMMEKSNKYAF